MKETKVTMWRDNWQIRKDHPLFPLQHLVWLDHQLQVLLDHYSYKAGLWYLRSPKKQTGISLKLLKSFTCIKGTCYFSSLFALWRTLKSAYKQPQERGLRLWSPAPLSCQSSSQENCLPRRASEFYRFFPLHALVHQPPSWYPWNPWVSSYTKALGIGRRMYGYVFLSITECTGKV